MEIANMHPATKLILARIESNPEEFDGQHHGRWTSILDELRVAATGEDWKLISSKLSEINMNRIHKDIMEELCAPEQTKFGYTTLPTKTTKIIAPKVMVNDALEVLMKSYEPTKESI